MVEIFREDFETGTTTMAIFENIGEVVISSEKPINGVYAARCRAFFDPSPGWKTAELRKSASLPQVVAEALIRVDVCNPVGQRIFGVSGSRAYLFILGFQYTVRTIYVMVGGVGTIILGRAWNLGEVYDVKVYVTGTAGNVVSYIAVN